MAGNCIPEKSSERFDVVRRVAVRHVFHGLLHLDLAVSLQDLGLEDVLFANQEGRDVLVVEPLEPGKGRKALENEVMNAVLFFSYLHCFFLTLMMHLIVTCCSSYIFVSINSLVSQHEVSVLAHQVLDARHDVIHRLLLRKKEKKNI